MAIDLDRYHLAMLTAYQDVCDGKKVWAVFGYDGLSNTLKLVESGKDLDDMPEELNSGKCMYAFCRVLDPKTNLNKLVLINWSGEGAPEQRKFACARHVNDVKKFFRGAHVTINARTDDEVDIDAIVEKVSSASSSSYDIGREPKVDTSPEHGPVGSVYQRTRPDKEIKASVRDKFWEEAEKEEQRRLEEEKRQRNAQKAKMEKERKEREAREAAERERKISEKMVKLERQRSVEYQAEKAQQDKVKRTWEQEQGDAAREEEERNRRAERMKEERAAEAASLVRRRDSNPRMIFEQKVAENPGVPERRPPPPRKIRRDFAPTESSVLPGERKKPIEIPRGDPEPVKEFAKPVPSNVQPVNSHSYTPSQPTRLPTSEPPPKQPEPEPVRRPEPVKQPEPEPVKQPDVVSGMPHQRNLLSEGLPPRQQDSDQEQDEDDWGDDEQLYSNVNEGTNGVEENVYSEMDSSQIRQEPAGAEEHQPPQNVYDSAQPQEEEEAIYQEAEPEAGDSPSLSPWKGCRVLALYDYQAEDDTEITFDPDDVITDVDPIDPGWWMGTAPDGHHGMFPANYVEVLPD